MFLPQCQWPSFTSIQSNLYLANSLAAAVSEPALYRLLTFQVPNLMSFFRYLCGSEVSVRIRDLTYECFITRYIFTLRRFNTSPKPPPSWRTTPCRLSATNSSIYSHLPSILEAGPPYATWGRAMPWWQGPTYHGHAHYTHCKIFEHFLLSFERNFDPAYLSKMWSASVGLCFNLHLTCIWNKGTSPFITTQRPSNDTKPYK